MNKEERDGKGGNEKWGGRVREGLFCIVFSGR
jgi:hypothetical protein